METNIIFLSKNAASKLCFYYYQKSDDEDDILIMFDSAMGKTNQQTWEVYETKDDEAMRRYNPEDDYSDMQAISALEARTNWINS